MEKQILTINGGSSSIKFALFSGDGSFAKILHGKIERIGLLGALLKIVDQEGREEVRELEIPNFNTAKEILNALLSERVDFSKVIVVGHRVVHGMARRGHARVTPELISELKETSAIDPEHLPFEIELIEMFAGVHPTLPQIACFDTVFHHDMPRVAQVLPLPRRFETKGLRRYGFHGLSCTSILEKLHSVDSERAGGRIIIAHLGSGASITAIRGGKSIDTSMGFSPTGGIPMSSRTGDLDPGALLYVMKNENLSHEALASLVNHQSGLLGVSETTSDMHDLLEREGSDERAHEAVEFFCYEAKKRIGAYIAALGGVDMIIFTGGMGEGAPRIRKLICSDLEFLGITIDEERNERSEEIISPETSPVRIRVMHTDEELMIARIANYLIHN
ncbi:MAG: acetate/propionate family kinase [Minisyncoccia bacterium]